MIDNKINVNISTVEPSFTDCDEDEHNAKVRLVVEDFCKRLWTATVCKLYDGIAKSSKQI